MKDFCKCANPGCTINDADSVDTKVSREGIIGSAGASQEAHMVVAISEKGAFQDEPWFTFLVSRQVARAFGARIGDRVRVTIEIIDEPDAASRT
jgi:hypothetical protein